MKTFQRLQILRSQFQFVKFRATATLAAPLAVLALFSSQMAFSDLGGITFKPQKVQVMPHDTFIPPGFDDNDNAQLVISGYLPNTCYKAGPVSAQVDHKQRKIYVQNTAYFYSGCWCGQVIIPYLHTVNLGILEAGQYQVYVQNDKSEYRAQGTMNIAASSSAVPDDYLYAPVQEAYLDSKDASGQADLVIRGRFTSDCMHLKEVKVLYRADRIIEILPIADLAENQACHDALTPFESRIKVQAPQDWKAGNVLVYVRSLNGQAISKVIEGY